MPLALLRQGAEDLGVALALLTRLPLPKLREAAFRRQAQAGWAFPLVGLAVAALAALVGRGALLLGLPAEVAAGLVLAAMAAMTGAMHEDGLADTVDGFWGGQSRERRLEIMKDSMIGSYGALALVLSAGLRWMALAELLPLGWGGLVCAACLSRAVLPGLMTALPPARAGGLSRAVGVPGVWASLVAAGIGLGLGLAAVGLTALGAAVAAGLAAVALGALAKARIGGQTGDVLGAAQQVAEIAVLLVLLAG